MDGFRVGRVDGLTGCIGKLRCGRDVRDVRILLLKQKGCGEYFPLLRILSIMSMGKKKKPAKFQEMRSSTCLFYPTNTEESLV